MRSVMPEIHSVCAQENEEEEEGEGAACSLHWLMRQLALLLAHSPAHTRFLYM
jgi:hypothetical protein